MKQKYRNTLLLMQGIYYLFTALWPLIDVSSFMDFTGFKTDVWLVKTVAVLVLCISLAFLVCAFLREASFAIMLLAVFSATGFFAIDLYYTSTNTIDGIYLADASIQLILICAWLLNFRVRNAEED